MTDNKNLWQKYRSIPIFYRIMTSLILGSIVGLIIGEPAGQLKPLGDILVRLLKMLVIPIVFLTLIMGMRKIKPSKLGVIGTETVLTYIVTTAIAIVFGLAIANIINPGIGVTLPGGAEAMEKTPPSIVEVFLGIIPQNPVGAMAEGNVLPTIFFAIIFGIGLSILQEESKEGSYVHEGATTLFNIIEVGAKVMFKIVWGVMEYAVFGVFFLMAWAFGTTGPQLITSFGRLILALGIAITIHITITYLLIIIMGLQGKSPISFLRGAKDAMTTAFSIRSSSGTLPVTMSNAEKNLRVDESIFSFTLPLGATINMDGTAMYQGIGAIFAANLIGVNLTIGQQVTVLVTAVLASVGTAGVPGSGLIMLTLILTQLGFPLEVIGFVAGIDPILDRMRTMNNVTGDLAVTTLIAKWNNAIDYNSGTWVSKKKREVEEPIEQ